MKPELKILTWNCNGAFRRKFAFIQSFESDIVIIQECENPEKSTDIEYKNWASNYLWIGDNKNRGLGIFAQEILKLKNLTGKLKERSISFLAV